MNALNYAPGLYVIRRMSHHTPGIWHYGILDVGNNYPIAGAFSPLPKLIHQCQPQLQWHWFEPAEGWEMVEQCPDLRAAIERISEFAANDPHYDLLENNCEHFANLVAYGEKRSSQVQIAFLAAGVLVLLVICRSE